MDGHFLQMYLKLQEKYCPGHLYYFYILGSIRPRSSVFNTVGFINSCFLDSYNLYKVIKLLNPIIILEY